MSEKSKTELIVQSTLVVNDLVLVNGKLTSGEIYGGGKNIAHFFCVETGGKWKIAAIGLPAPEGRTAGIRSFGLEHVEGSKELEEGYTLVSK